MHRVTVIGVGSAHGNDQVGWQLIERLQQAGFDKRFEPGSVSLQVCRFPAQLMKQLEDCEQAIILDAVNLAPGTLTEFNTQDLQLRKDFHSTHGIGVGEALALAQQLLPGPVAVRILGIGVGNPGDADNIDVATLLPRLHSWLNTAIQQH